MPAEFVYTIIRAPRRSGPEVAAELRAARPWLALAGGPGIGWASDEFPVIAATGQGTGGGPALDTLTGPAGSVGPGERLVATVRPDGPTPPRPEGGIVALRRFDVAAADADEFVDLSQAAWRPFEELYQTRILGLFRGGERRRLHATFLLSTWYSSLAEWERSRQAVAADTGEAAAVGRRFRRRREITLRTEVRVGVPL